MLAKVLGEGQLPTTKGTLYTCPASMVAYVRFISVYNTNAASQTVKLYLKPGATSRGIPPRMVLAQDEGARFLSEGELLILEAGDLIEGETTTASAVDYLIEGVEEEA